MVCGGEGPLQTKILNIAPYVVSSEERTRSTHGTWALAGDAAPHQLAACRGLTQVGLTRQVAPPWKGLANEYFAEVCAHRACQSIAHHLPVMTEGIV